MEKKSRMWVSLAVILLLAAVGAAWGYARYRHNEVFVETEDAYVQGKVVPVSSRVPGSILSLKVKENEPVKAGQVLAVLDSRDFEALEEKARGSIAEARASQALNRSQIAQAQAQVKAAESQQSLAALEKKRLEALVERNSVPRQKLDQATTAFDVASAQLEAARKQVAAIQDALGVSASKEAQARASLAQASLQHSYCTVAAPCDGVVTRKMAEEGMVVAPGQPLLAVVPLGEEEIWIEANYKETQLHRVRPGQSVELRTDLDGRVIPGVVESLAAGTGSAFSLLPPENATGNWVKVVQRVPVRIRLAPGADPDHRLRLGLSVSAVIDTRDTARP
jgi:membrane fusion protein (multidrug efflux system)